MASDLGDLSIKIGGDSKDYIESLRAAKQQLAEFARSNDLSLGEASSVLSAWGRDQKRTLEEASKSLRDHQAEMAKSAGSTDAFVGSLSVMKVAAAGAAVALYELGGKLAETANLLDPSGAKEWYATTVELDDAWGNLAGTLGELVRPALEGVKKDMIAAIHAINTPETKTHLEEVKTAAGQLWDKAGEGLDTLWSKVGDFATYATDKLAQIGGLATHSDVLRDDAARAARNPQPAAAEVKDVPLISAEEIMMQGATALRAMREEGKEMRESVKLAAEHYSKAESVAAMEKENAKFALDSSNKTLADKQAMLVLQQKADESTRAAARENLKLAEAQLAAFSAKHNETKDRAANDAAEARLADAHNNIDPIQKAKDSVTTRNYMMETQQRTMLEANLIRMRGEADKASLQAVKDQHAIKLNDIALQKQNEKDDATWAMSAAQFTYDLSNKTNADEMALLAAKRDLASKESETAADAAAAALKVLEAARALEAARIRGNNEAIDAARSAEGGAAQRRFNESNGTAADQIQLLQAQAKAANDFASMNSDNADAQEKAMNAQSALNVAGKNYNNAPGQIMSQGVMSAGGAAGGVISGAISGAAAGGPMGAIASVVTSLLTMSDAFKSIISTVNGILPIIANLLPVIAMLSSGPIVPLIMAFSMLWPLIGPLVSSIQKVISGLSSGFQKGIEELGKLVGYLGTSLQRAAELFDPVAEIMNRIVMALTTSFGPIIGRLGNAMEVIANILNSALLPVLPVLQTLFQDLADELAGPLGSAIGVVFNVIMKVAGTFLQIVGGFSTAVGSIIQSIDQVLNEFMNALGGKNGMAGALYGSIKDLMDTYNAFDAAGSAATDAGNALAKTTWDSIPPILSLGNAADQVSQQLLNMPQAFSVAQAYNQALAQSGSLASGALAVTTGTIGPLGITTNWGSDSGGAEGGRTGSRPSDHDAFMRSRGSSSTSDQGDTFILEEVTIVANDPVALANALRKINVGAGLGPGIRPIPRPMRIDSNTR